MKIAKMVMSSRSWSSFCKWKELHCRRHATKEKAGILGDIIELVIEINNSKRCCFSTIIANLSIESLSKQYSICSETFG
jgi:hypothetical protein